MQRMSVPWVMTVVEAVDALQSVQIGKTYGQVWGFVYDAKTQMEALFDQSLYRRSLHSSRQSATDLHTTATSILGKTFDDAVTDADAWIVSNQRDKFRTVFLAELATLPCFFVSPKPPYDTEILLDAGEALMPADLAHKVPEAVFDAKECSRALAFELATASGFHSFRLLESVVRRYHKEISNGSAPPKQRNLGVYIRALGSAGGDPKVIAALTQIKDLHRNPLAHPEVALKLDEAISIVGMVRSAVAAMLDLLPEPPQTTSSIFD